MIELKRPSQSIIGTYSSKIIVPSRHLTIAKQQATLYLDAIQRGQFLNSDDFFMAGNRRHAFIILGMSSEITQKCQSEIYKMQFRNILPDGFHLFTYDELLSLFATTVPPLLQVLFISPASIDGQDVIETFVLKWRFGLHARPCAKLSITSDHFLSDVSVRYGDKNVSAASILGLMSLGAPYGSELEISASGFDARSAVSAIGELIQSNFFMKDADGSLLPKDFMRLLESTGTLAPEKRRSMIAEAAYYLAENDSYRRGPKEYWCRAEKEIVDKLLSGELNEYD